MTIHNINDIPGRVVAFRCTKPRREALGDGLTAWRIGRAEALEEAAHLAWGNDCDTDRNWLDWGEDRNRRTAVCVSNEIATAIRALITKPTDITEHEDDRRNQA